MDRNQASEEPILQIVRQEANEQRYSRKHIDKRIKAAIEANPEMMVKHAKGVELVNAFMNQSYYPSKDARIDQLKLLETSTIVMELFIGIAYLQKPELFTSIMAMLAARLGFNDKEAAVTTVGELLAVLCNTDAFDLLKEHKYAPIQVRSCIALPASVMKHIEESEYLPPMVCIPLELTHNFSSGYLTHNDSLILGSGNHHDGDICLDVLNTMNQVALRLDTEFLSKVEEEPTFELDDAQKARVWHDFKTQSYQFYKLMVDGGNKLYMTHKVDKRGRIYSQGYHITTQGTAFKKAMLEFANEQLVQGVPSQP